MLCEKCGKRQATTHIKKNINGIYEEHHYCSECAAQSGVNAFPSFGAFGDGGLFGSLMGLPFSGPSSHKPASDTLRCPFCGVSFAEISDSGRVGCAKCYDTFKKQLLPTVERIHGRASHTGKAPQTELSEEDKKLQKLEELKNKLQSAVDAQEYEQAAKYRDEIKALEGEHDEQK